MTRLTTEQDAEIKALRSTPAATLRPISPGLEKVLHEAFQVLDHGLIRVVDYMGDDSAIVQAARVSYGRGTKRVQEDRGLINYLMRHYHTTPFEMAEIKFHVKLPIFVARQWIRHRTASVNEYSARYSVLDNEFYIPEPQHLAAQSSSNRQGRGAVLEGDEAAEVLSLLRRDAENAYSGYTTMLNEQENPDHQDARVGLARELARMNLSLNFYTQWYWKTNLHNLMNFLRLRADKHAQYEIRAYADIMLDIMAAWVPLAHAAFLEHRMDAVQLSGSAVKLVRRLIAGETVTQDDSGLNPREWQELSAALGL
ncbi:FAD-dependent thymidylate synthase [Rhizobium leguminosarum]|uniref:FAD-dependent thymidylate synthase n=1 Tax=Rhizobium leguminosarum TaxID=384 RepID=UPI001031F317|nr:FAD-dependent thymidylate synthase [Rhizobium leguminosarum]TAY99665.1 FAD-dependent thymidylate synthase [Rhizobium leguminosarum]TAZ10535.1 FAD-dependent thymidylate synthase [Rhizobium leguminosarum]